MSNPDIHSMIESSICNAREPLKPYVYFISKTLYEQILEMGWNMSGFVVSDKIPQFESEIPTATTEGFRAVLERINKE